MMFELNVFYTDVDGYAILLKEKFVRCPLKMDDPELVLCQAHGQARPIADFLHENGKYSFQTCRYITT